MKITKLQALKVIQTIIDAFEEDAEARAATLCDENKRKALGREDRVRTLIDIEAQFRGATILKNRADHIAYSVERMNQE